METITGVAKWNLETNQWRNIETIQDSRRALSFVHYRDIIHNEEEPLNYILIADGCRVENHSKDAKHIKERCAGISNVISYFEKKKENYCIELILVDNDAPLKEESKQFAKHIDFLAKHPFVRTINYVGFSKCGVIGFDMIKHMKNPQSLMKTRIYSVSAPYEGTIIASPKALMIEIRKLILAKLGDNAFGNMVADAVENKYRSILSNSHMDLDIAVPGGVPDDLMKCY